MNLLEAMFLGTVQGLTEWLPVSSSGHLVIFQEIFHIKVPLFFDTMLHLGTLLSVFIFLRKDILEVLKSLARLDFDSPSGKVGLFIITGTVPVVIVGILFHDIIESSFSNLRVVGLSLIITGILLRLTKNKRGKKHLTLIDSLIVGFAQAISLIPGMSRSGSTISTGILRRVDRRLIFKFSFLLSIPAILGANVLELSNIMVDNASVDILPLAIGTLTATIFGYLSLRFLYGMVKRDSFYLFCYYCWSIGIIVLLYSFVRT